MVNTGHVPRDEDVKEWAEINQVVTLGLPGSELELNSEPSVRERKMRGRPSRWPAACGDGAGFVGSHVGSRTALILQTGDRI